MTKEWFYIIKQIEAITAAYPLSAKLHTFSLIMKLKTLDVSDGLITVPHWNKRLHDNQPNAQKLEHKGTMEVDDVCSLIISSLAALRRSRPNSYCCLSYMSVVNALERRGK